MCVEGVFLFTVVESRIRRDQMMLMRRPRIRNLLFFLLLKQNGVEFGKWLPGSPRSATQQWKGEEEKSATSAGSAQILAVLISINDPATQVVFADKTPKTI